MCRYLLKLEIILIFFSSVQYSKNKYVFALTGKTWATVKQHYPELISKLVTRGAIFARMSPDQKQQLVQELQALGYYVGEYKRVVSTNQCNL